MPPPARSKDLGTWQITLFNVLCVTGLGSLPHTFLLAYVCSPIYYLSTAVRVLSGSFVEEPALRHVYSLSGYIHRVDRNVIPCSYPNIHKDFSSGSMMCYNQFTKVTTASPHITQAYQTHSTLY